MKKIELVCPKCSAKLDISENNDRVNCSYCGYQALLVEDKTKENNVRMIEQESYAKAKGEYKALSQYSFRKFIGNLIKFIIIIGLLVAAVYFFYNREQAKKPEIDPFAYLDIQFKGKNGEGKLEIKHKVSSDDIVPTKISFDASKTDNLFEGDKVSVDARSESYRLKSKTKVYDVKGLDLYLDNLDKLSDEAVEVINDYTLGELEEDITDSLIDNVKSYTAKPYKMYLVTDKANTNRLYDAFEVDITAQDGKKMKYYKVQRYNNIIVRDGKTVSIDFSGDYDYGGFVEVKSKGNLTDYLHGFISEKKIKAQILTDQEIGMEYFERAPK